MWGNVGDDCRPIGIVCYPATRSRLAPAARGAVGVRIAATTALGRKFADLAWLERIVFR
jgi:hypothetical protein